LTRSEQIVYFFRDLHGQYPITKKVLARRTLEYRGWVQGYARNHKIPILKAEKGVSKEDAVRPYLRRMGRRNQDGVYGIFPSMEIGSKFQSKMPKFPTDDPNYRIIWRGRSRYLHYHFYIRDPVIGPLAMCIGTYLPFQTTYYRNGHNFMEIELRQQGSCRWRNRSMPRTDWRRDGLYRASPALPPACRSPSPAIATTH
jgi:hypothetical protein